MRVLFYVTMAVLVVALLGPPGCRRIREHVLLSLVRDSERPIDIVDDEPLVFRFPPTDVRAVAVIDYQDAATGDAHLSFVPPDGSSDYAWAAGVCPEWSAQCLESMPARTLSELTYGRVPEGLHQIEPTVGTVAPLQAHRLYGLALLGTRLFSLKVFYRDEHGVHLMEGTRFAEAIVHNRRGELREFLGTH